MDLEALRKQVDQIDDQIIDLLAQRMQLVDQIGRYKQQHGISALDQDRFDQLLNRLKALARRRDLSEELVQSVYRSIHQSALKRQGKLK